MIILFDFFLPVGAQRRIAADGGDRLAKNLIVQPGAITVAVVVHSPLRCDPHAAGGFHRVYVGPQEEKLPPVLLCMPADHALHPFRGIAPAGIFHPIRGDDKQGVFRDIFRPGILVDVSDVVDSAAHRVQQGGAASDKIFLLGD